MESAIVVGAGLVGSLLSIYLAEKGFKVDVYERNPDLREVTQDMGRSINITLCKRGFHALDLVGAGDNVRKLCVPCYGRVIHTGDGELRYQAYGSNQEAIYSIGRHDLNKSLLDSAERIPNVDIHFNNSCIGLDLENCELTFKNTTNDETRIVQGDRIFAADGAYSVVRQEMQRLKRFNFSQEYWGQGYREIITPVMKGSPLALERNAIHIWPRDNFMLIGFPNLDHSFTLTLHLPFEGDISHETINTPEEIGLLFQKYFPDIFPVVETCLDNSANSPVGTMVTIKSSPWKYRDRAVLIGDASHAIFPSYGQGANAGFEDCKVLSECIDKHSGKWLTIFEEYERLRKQNLDTMADLCFDHFRFLTKDVGEQDFLVRDKIEKMIHEQHPEVRSLYYNISFTNRTYSESAKNARDFEELVIDTIKERSDIAEKLASKENHDWITPVNSSHQTGVTDTQY
jgi:kynurenine 3-monooxygenase